jgi:hypothetical protein
VRAQKFDDAAKQIANLKARKPATPVQPATAPADSRSSKHRPEILKPARFVQIPQHYAWGFPSDHSVCPKCRRTIDVSPDGRCIRESCEDTFPKFFLVNTKLLKACFRPKISRCFQRGCNSVCRLVEKSFQSSLCRAFDDGCWNLCAPIDKWTGLVATILKKSTSGRKTAYFKLRALVTPRALEVFNPNVNGSVLAGLLRELLHVWHTPVQPKAGEADTGCFWMNHCPFAFIESDLSELRDMFRSFHQSFPSMNIYPFACVRRHCVNVLTWTRSLRTLLPIRITRIVWKVVNKTIGETLRFVPPGVFRSELPASKGDLLFNTSVWSTASVGCYNMHASIAKCTQNLINNSASACERLIDDIESTFWPILASCLCFSEQNLGLPSVSPGGECVRGKKVFNRGQRGRGHRVPTFRAAPSHRYGLECRWCCGLWV